MTNTAFSVIIYIFEGFIFYFILMTNFNSANTTNVADNDLSIDNLKSLTPEKQEALLSNKDDSILIALRDEAIASEHYEVAAIIRDTLKNKAQEKVDTENKETQNEIETKRVETNKENQTKIESLKEMLEKVDNDFEIWNKIEYDNSKWTKITAEIVEKDKDWDLPKEWDIVLKIGNNYRHMTQSTLENNSTFKVIDQKNKLKSSLKELIEGLLQSQEDIRKENSSLLEDLQDAQRKWDKKRIDNFKNLIKELENKNKDLKDRYQKETIKYPADEIATMDTKLINWRWWSRKTIKTEDGYETLRKRPNVKRNKNIRSLRKLNQVVHALNNFKKDSDNAVDYILTEERGSRIDNLMWVDALWKAINRFQYKFLFKMWFVMSKSEFEEKFDAQQEKIIGKFKTNINPAKWSDVANKIEAIEKRFKRHKQEYTNKHYG